MLLLEFVFGLQGIRKAHTETIFSQIFGQVFDHIFGQVFNQKYIFTVLLGQQLGEHPGNQEKGLGNSTEIQHKSRYLTELPC